MQRLLRKQKKGICHRLRSRKDLPVDSHLRTEAIFIHYHISSAVQLFT